MYCVNCGNELPDGARFCTECGTAITQPSNNDAYSTTEPEINQDIPVQSVNTVSAPAPEKKWKDQYTILIIIGVMLVAVVIGLAIRSLNKSNQPTEGYMADEEDVYTEDDYDYYDDYEDYEEEDSVADSDTQQETDNNQTESVNPEYVLPESNSRYLTKSDLAGLTAEQCRIARNEIYARHGRMFKDEALQAYFNALSWYTPTIQPDAFSDSMLNAYETANRDLIVEYETEQGYR